MFLFYMFQQNFGLLSLTFKPCYIRFFGFHSFPDFPVLGCVVHVLTQVFTAFYYKWGQSQPSVEFSDFVCEPPVRT